MLYITLMCIAYIIGIIWGLFLTKVGYSPFIFIIIAILFIFKKNPKVDKNQISKIILLCALILIGLLNCRVRFNRFENNYQNKSIVRFSGYIDRKMSDTKFIFVNEYNHKFIVYKLNNNELEEDMMINISGSFVMPSHARNHNRI